MKTTRLAFLFLLLLAILNSNARSQDASGGELTKGDSTAGIEERMKKKAEFARKWLMGGVYQPTGIAIEPNEPVKRIKLHNYYAGMVAVIYAKISRKEVLVSKNVAPRKVSTLIENVSQAEALQELERILFEVGVDVVSVNDKTVAFLELESENNL